MRKKFVQFAALVLALCLIPTIPVHAAGEDTVIRVGLCYGNSAMEGANLLNSTGSGYRFGYYDSANRFVELASTAEKAVSVVKATNVGYTAAPTTAYCNYRENLADTASVAVGCYHLQLDGNYTSFADAQAAAIRYTGGFVAFIDGTYYVRVGNYLTRSAAEAAQAALGVNTVILGTSSYGVSVVITGTNTILFQYDDKGGGTGLGVQPDQSEDSADHITWFKGYQYYGGFRFERISGGSLTVVNIVPLEDYIRGILPYEMSSSWPLEALKAQAVCARSYAITSLNKHNDNHFDICNTTDCQVYRGTGSANATTDRAVSETAGQYVRYNGGICQAVYFSSDGGATENSENVWNSALPYLRGRFDPYEASVADKISNYRWTVTYTGKELQARLNSLNSKYNFGEIADLYVSQVTGTDNVYSVVVVDVNGKSQTFSKENARTILGVRSQRFTISGGNGGGEYSVTGGTLSSIAGAWTIGGDGSLSQVSTDGVYAITGSGVEQVTARTETGGSSTGTNTFVISGTGNGHNVGMSQWGAYAMAQQGYTYQDILKFYFTGVEIY